MTRSVPTSIAAAYRPRSPFLGWPEQARFDGGYAWFTPYGGAIVTQTVTDVATTRTVHSLADFLDRMLRAGIEQRVPNLLVLHDWRSLNSVAKGARAAWTARTRREFGGYKQCDIYVALNANPLLRMALRSAALTTQLALGQRAARFVDDLAPVIKSRRLCAPPAGTSERLLAGVTAMTGGYRSP